MYWTLSFLVFSMNWMFPASAVTLSNLPHWEGAIGEVKIMVSGFSLPLASWVNLSELLNCELQFLIYNLENNCIQLLGMLRCLNTKCVVRFIRTHIKWMQAINFYKKQYLSDDLSKMGRLLLKPKHFVL